MNKLYIHRSIKFTYPVQHTIFSNFFNFLSNVTTHVRRENLAFSATRDCVRKNELLGGQAAVELARDYRESPLNTRHGSGIHSFKLSPPPSSFLP